MSIALMTAVSWRRDLNTHEKIVMTMLADHANDDGMCYPSIDGLAVRTSMSDRGVQKIIARMVERGFLTVQHGAAKNGRNLYTIHLPPPPVEEETPTPNPVHPEPGSPRTAFTPNPVPVYPEPGSPLTPNPVHPNPHITLKEPPPLAAAGEIDGLDGFIADLCRAVGIGGPPPRSWSGKRGRAHIASWLARLDRAEVLRRAAASRQQHPQAPGTPQALDGFMASAVVPTGPAPASADPMAALRFKADWINGSKAVPQTLATPSDLAAMVRAKLVTPQKLKERGLA